MCYRGRVRPTALAAYRSSTGVFLWQHLGPYSRALPVAFVLLTLPPRFLAAIRKCGDRLPPKCHRLDDATGHRWPVKVGRARRCPVGRGLRGSRVGGSGQSGQSAGRLAGCGCPEGELFHRRENEHYGQAPELAAADIIVEDDCESIGGPAQMTYPKLGPDSKARTKSVVIPEWGGIDHLPTDPEKLRTY